MEPEEENKWCESCEFYEWDNWYPGEHECVNSKSFRCGETVDKFDSCDWWEKRE